MVKIKFKKLNSNATIPKYIRENEAAMDLYSIEDYLLKAGERKVFKIGIMSEIPSGYVAIIKDRSGLAAKQGITSLAGVIDCDYRGEWGIVLLNTSEESYEIKIGDRIAQVMILPIIHPEIEEAKEINTDTPRGEGGFGSTGN